MVILMGLELMVKVGVGGRIGRGGLQDDDDAWNVTMFSLGCLKGC